MAADHGGTAAAIGDALRANTEKIRQFDEYNVIMQALRKQIVDTVEENFIMSLRNMYTRYSSVHPKDLLAYLFETYGKITPEDVIANEKKLIEDWDGNEAFEVIIERVNNCIDFANEAGRDYTDKQIMDRVFVIVANTGLYADDLKIWKKRPEDEKSWPEFFKNLCSTHRQSSANNKQPTSKWDMAYRPRSWKSWRN